jgi:hypothetical protein
MKMLRYLGLTPRGHEHAQVLRGTPRGHEHAQVLRVKATWS